MNLDAFLESTATRIPTIPELVGLCDELKIGFAFKEGQPVLRPNSDNKSEALVLATLFRREPFRSQVLAAKSAHLNPDRLMLKYADGATAWADETDRITEQPTHCRYADESDWTPIPSDPF
jgi:hypothetical protein